MEPKVLIVILNYKTYRLTIDLIRQLKNIRYKNFDCMVIDNNSPNESKEILNEYSKKLNYIFYANSDNSGYATGNNIGLKFATKNNYKYSWILNSDIRLEDLNVLSHMVSIAESDETLGAIGPQIWSMDGFIMSPYVNRPNLWNMTFGIFLDKKYRDKNKDISQKVYRLYGCCMLLKNRVMETINYLDEDTFLYGEESILSERMMKVNTYCYYDAEVHVVHLESASLKLAKDKKKIQMLESTKSREIYLKKYRHYNVFFRVLCHVFRNLVIYLK